MFDLNRSLIRFHYLGPVLREKRCHHLAHTEHQQRIQADQPVLSGRLRAWTGGGLSAKTGLHGVRLSVTVRLLQGQRQSIPDGEVSGGFLDFLFEAEQVSTNQNLFFAGQTIG